MNIGQIKVLAWGSAALLTLGASACAVPLAPGYRILTESREVRFAPGQPAELHVRALYTVETHVTHRAEAGALEPLYVTTQILGLDDKRVHLLHHLNRRRDDRLVATGEQLYLHVNSAAGKASPMDAALHARLEKIRIAQAGIDQPPRSASVS